MSPDDDLAVDLLALAAETVRLTHDVGFDRDPLLGRPHGGPRDRTDGGSWTLAARVTDVSWSEVGKEKAEMFVSLFGDRRGTLPTGWTKEVIVSLLGDARIDASAAPGEGATVTFMGLVGDAIIRVPPGSRVTGGGFSVFGDRTIEVSPGDGPMIRLNVFAVFGDLQVTDRLAV